MNNPADASTSSPRRVKLIKLLKIGLIAGIAVGIGLQFVPVKGIGVNPPERYKIDAPPEVEAILRESCFDCHSNETKWPFYARIAPGSWLMARDVLKGRSRMNMSEWGETDEEERALDREASWDEIQEGEMPPWFYIPMHPGARLDDKEKALLKEWMLKKKPAEAPAVAAPAEGETGTPAEGAAAAATAAGAAAATTSKAAAGATDKSPKARPGKQPLRRRAKAGRPGTKQKASRARGNRPRPR
jgi:hypothetical protein